MIDILLSVRPKWCEKICHEIGKNDNGKPIYEKPIEVRKSKPSEVPFRGLIYATKQKEWYKCGAVYVSDESLLLANGKVEMYGGSKFWGDNVEDYQCLNGKVICEFICDKVYSIKNQGNSFVVANEEQGVTNEIARQSCLDYDDMVGYLGNKDGYGWHISDLKIYDKPRALSEFNRPCVSLTRNCEDCIKGKTPYTWDFDGDKGTIFCTRKIKRPPQSWCYVEEDK